MNCHRSFECTRAGLIIACFWSAAVGGGKADEAHSGGRFPSDLTDLSLEQLVDIEVTSVSKKKSSVLESPAAVYVITQEDIRRSGLSCIPELLRMVPGLDVARIDANHWAISSRGFNDSYSDKLLVLIDGRAVYTPGFSGVYWNVQDLPLEDVERIEVIRGPGATLWGANAVNGVINIITKRAGDTQGGLVSVVGGTEDRPSSTLRYGGQLGTNLFYRAYVKYFDRTGFNSSSVRDDADDWTATRGGFRMDWEPSRSDSFTLQGDYYQNDAGETVDQAVWTAPFVQRKTLIDPNEGGNVVGRWTRTFSTASQLTLQMYYDHMRQTDAPAVADNDTYDLDLQHRFALGRRQDIVWGAGYRYLVEDISPSFFVTVSPRRRYDRLFSAFLQDEITIVDNRWHFTLGSKIEHNDYTGFEAQPSGRLSWTPSTRQTVWASVSRAVRTPSAVDTGVRQNRAIIPSSSGLPTLVAVVGNPDFSSEELLAHELGYRIECTPRLSFDMAAFYNVYDDLRDFVPTEGQLETDPAPPHWLMPVVAQNRVEGETYGAEWETEWRVTDKWKMKAGYTWLEMQLHSELATSKNDDSPQNQFHLSSYLDLPRHVELNGAVYYVDNITQGEVSTRIPSYVRLDVGVTWRPVRSLECGLWGQNLLDDQHSEFTSYKTTNIEAIPRSVVGRIAWAF